MEHRFNVGEKVFWNDPDEGISSGEYWIVGTNGEVLELMSKDSVVEAFPDECTLII